MKTLTRYLRTCAFVVLAFPLMANQSCEEQASVRKLRKRVTLADPRNAIYAPSFTLPGGVVYNNLGPLVSGQLKLTLHKSEDFYIFERAAPRKDMMAAGVTTPYCVQDFAMYEIAGSIPAFEFVSKTKVSFGYSRSGDFGTIIVQPTVEVERAQLDMFLETHNPVTRILNGMGSASADDTKTSLKATVGWNDFNVTPEVFKDKPIGKVTQKALDKSLKQLAADTAGQEWFAQVESDGDRIITINAGKNAGLKKGDVLTVHNQVYVWQNNGTPCEVPLLRHFDKRNGTPDAIIVLDQVGDDYSVSAVDPERPTEEPVMPGAIVRVKQLAP